MTRMLLTISEPDADAALQGGVFDEVFLWARSGRSTFTGSVDPYLSGLGPVNPRNVDLVRVALGVLAADRSALREGGGSSWNAREFDLTVPVADVPVWTSRADQLARLVGSLSGDHWTFQFSPAPPAGETAPTIEEQRHDRTVLLSGGADSAAGALLSAVELGAGHSQALVSHYSSTAISPVQRDLAAAVAELVPGICQMHHQFHLHRRSRRLDGTSFRSESSTRSRSLLFLALGLAVAERADSPLWIAENGFASLNPSLGPDRRGSLSTLTTHPSFLRDLADLVQDVGGHGLIENPFEGLTKGEMFRRVADAVSLDASSTYLSATDSCSHTDARYSGAPVGASCGVCFGCLVRRAAFTASGIPDKTTYLVNDTSGQFGDFVKQKSILEPMRDFVYRGVQPRDVMAMSLPHDYAARDALSLCQRGVEELRSLFT
jgi:7-cyano-7-deazaguanine synthase in queuosine biosynthesis